VLLLDISGYSAMMVGKTKAMNMASMTGKLSFMRCLQVEHVKEACGKRDMRRPRKAA
jgi:hypothetical protein